MFNFSQLASGLIVPGIARLRRSLFDVGSALVLLVLAALAGLLGLGFLLYGIYQSLLQMPMLEPWMAGAIVALAAMLVCLLLVLLARRRLTRAGRSESPPGPGQVAADVSEHLEEAKERGIRAGEELRRNVKPIDLALSAFVAGLVASKALREGNRKKKTRTDKPRY